MIIWKADSRCEVAFFLPRPHDESPGKLTSKVRRLADEIEEHRGTIQLAHASRSDDRSSLESFASEPLAAPENRIKEPQRFFAEPCSS